MYSVTRQDGSFSRVRVASRVRAYGNWFRVSKRADRCCSNDSVVRRGGAKARAMCFADCQIPTQVLLLFSWVCRAQTRIDGLVKQQMNRERTTAQGRASSLSLFGGKRTLTTPLTPVFDMQKSGSFLPSLYYCNAHTRVDEFQRNKDNEEEEQVRYRGKEGSWGKVTIG